MREINLYCPSGRAFHTTACLVQGFMELGVSIKSNINFSSETIDSRGISTPFSTTKLPKVDKLDLNHVGPILVDITHGFGDLELLQKLILKKDLLIINMSDSANFQDFPEGVKIATAHLNKFAKRSGRFFPMPFGLSNDLIELGARGNDFSKRLPKVIQNFKPSLSQGVRNFLALSLEELLTHKGYLYATSSSRDNYVDLLQSHMFICAYGGELYRDLQVADKFGDNSFQNNPAYKFREIKQEYVVLRWDSWRFYEAAVFGCLPLQLDYVKYGFDMPKPLSEDLYVKVDLKNINLTIDRLENLITNTKLYEETSCALRRWTLENYSPVALARYVLGLLDLEIN